MLSKLLADSKKDNEKLRDANTKLRVQVDQLEEEMKTLEEKLGTQEALWIKAFDMVSPKNKNTKKRTQNLQFTIPEKASEGKKGEKGKPKANYKQNMKTMIHQKYIKKLEDQQKRHEGEMDNMRHDYATQIEEMTEHIAGMSQGMIEVGIDTQNKCRSMFDIILGKDITIEELEDRIQNLSSNNRQQ